MRIQDPDMVQNVQINFIASGNRASARWYDEPMYLETEMDQDDPQRHKGGWGLNEEGGPQHAVPLAAPVDHHGWEPDDRDQEVVQKDQRTVNQESSKRTI